MIKMQNDKEILMQSIDIIIAERLSKLKYAYILTGVITTVVDSVNYKVFIDDSETSVKATNGVTYLVGDIVEILVENNNSSYEKKILWKRP